MIHMITILTSVSCHAHMCVTSTVKQIIKEFLTHVIKKCDENFWPLVRASDIVAWLALTSKVMRP
jgi:hypothetical protein